MNRLIFILVLLLGCGSNSETNELQSNLAKEQEPIMLFAQTYPPGQGTWNYYLKIPEQIRANMPYGEESSFNAEFISDQRVKLIKTTYYDESGDTLSGQFEFDEFGNLMY